MSEKYVITIGRQLGSGGRQIGEKLANSLGISFYDKELINLASQQSGLGKEFFEKADEKTKFSIFDNFIGPQFSRNYLGHETLFEIQSDVIRNLAQNHSCVFVGRCADYILREHPRCINLFICADEEDRIRRTEIRKNFSWKEAKDLNERIDRKRREYYNFYSNKHWGRASSYHLCINSSVLGIEETVNFILQFTQHKFLL